LYPIKTDMRRWVPTTGPIRRGFTLIEAALVTVIIGVGVMAMMQLLAAGTMQNGAGAKLTTGLAMAGNIRELTLDMAFSDPDQTASWGTESGEAAVAAYDDLDDLDGKTFNPPIDARRQSIASQDQWTQMIEVQCVDPDLITTTVPSGSSPMARVTVTVLCGGQEVCKTSWLAVDPDN